MQHVEVRKEVELIGGYKDAAGKEHRRVVFGRQITCEDLFAMDADPQAESQTQYQLLQTLRKIVSFGELRVGDGQGTGEPLTLKTLLELDTIDLDILSDAEGEFDEACADGARAEPAEGMSGIRLAHGFVVGETRLDKVEFGRRLKGLDEAEADGMKLRGVARNCFLIGRQISKLTALGVVAAVEGPVPLEHFRKLPVTDFYALKLACEFWRQSFRLKRGAVQKDGAGA